MNRTEYDQIDAVNFSTLKHILTTPFHYQDALAQKQEQTEEDKLRYAVGTLAHAMVLEGKNLMSMFAIKPKGMTFASNEGKAWKARQTLPILTQDEADSIPRMADAVANDPEARKILELCPLREHAVVTEIQGIRCKALLDAYGSDTAKKPLIPDFKTTRDASPYGFKKAIADRDYDFQCEWYSRLQMAKLELKEPPQFVWITVENVRPFIVQCYYPEPDVWKSGRKKADRALELLMKCRETGEWPAYGGGLQGISMPTWANKED